MSGATKFSDTEATANFSAEAQQIRRARLTPENIRQEMCSWRDRAQDGAYYKAMDLIRLTRYLRCSPAERVQLIDRIDDILAEVQDEIGLR
jgi:hypothetical protein